MFFSVAMLSLVACQSSTSELAELFPTGVHLQAEYAIPAELEDMQSVHETMNYLLYLPEGYWDDDDAEWPLIFFLHGAGDDDNDSTFVMGYGLPAVLFLDEQPAEFPFVVVSPQAFEGLAWWESETLRVLSALLDEVLATYRVDPNRVYLTGLSMGGYGSWWMASAYPEKFAAMVSISGSGYRSTTIPGPELLCQMEGIPVWAIHGAQDSISQPAASKAFAAALETTCNTEVKWTLYDDVGHFGAYERAYRDPALYEWLLEQELTR
jgi:predicted peptidase